MIIYQNGLITLDYDPATDILFVEWPEIQAVVLPEIKQALKILVEHIKNYDIKRLLIDSSKTHIEIEDEAYQQVLVDFGRNVMNTRLEKLARIQTNNPKRENHVHHVQQISGFTVQLENFSSKEEAMDWLRLARPQPI